MNKTPRRVNPTTRAINCASEERESMTRVEPDVPADPHRMYPKNWEARRRSMFRNHDDLGGAVTFGGGLGGVALD